MKKGKSSGLEALRLLVFFAAVSLLNFACAEKVERRVRKTVCFLFIYITDTHTTKRHQVHTSARSGEFTRSGLRCTIVVFRILALVLVPFRTVRAAHRHRIVWRPHRIMVWIAGSVTLQGGRGGGHIEVRQRRLVRSVAEQSLLFIVPPRCRTAEVVVPGVP